MPDLLNLARRVLEQATADEEVEVYVSHGRETSVRVFEGAIDFPAPDRFYQIVHKYRVNKIFTSPTALRMLMKYGEKLMEPYDLSCLEVISLVGEPFSPEAWHWTDQKLGKGKVYINNTWGQTESA